MPFDPGIQFERLTLEIFVPFNVKRLAYRKSNPPTRVTRNKKQQKYFLTLIIFLVRSYISFDNVPNTFLSKDVIYSILEQNNTFNICFIQRATTSVQKKYLIFHPLSLVIFLKYWTRAVIM